jgi:hypothetical protein
VQRLCRGRMRASSWLWLLIQPSKPHCTCSCDIPVPGREPSR